MGTNSGVGARWDSGFGDCETKDPPLCHLSIRLYIEGLESHSTPQAHLVSRDSGSARRSFRVQKGWPLWEVVTEFKVSIKQG